MFLKKVHLHNFKAQRDTELQMGEFTVLTGNNAAGKTTVLQALVLLKQSLSRGQVVFNDYLLQLGDFAEVIHCHDTSSSFGIGAYFDIDSMEVVYEVQISAKATSEVLKVEGQVAWQWDSADPHSLEPAERLFLPQAAKGYGGGQYVVQDPEQMQCIVNYQRLVLDWFGNMLYLSSARGFTKYSYPLLAGQPETDEVAKRAGDSSLLEEWLANLIMYNINKARRYPEMRSQLDVMSERLKRVGVDINPYVMEGPSVVVDLSENDMWVSAVNSGYGINQLVSFVVLGTLLPPDTMISIEEPEIHLHPRTQRIICEILVEIAKEGKQVCITTHSEYMLKTLRDLMDKNAIGGDSVKIYHLQKSDRVTRPSLLNLSDEGIFDELFG